MEIREVQQFRQRWLWVPLLLISLMIIGLFGYGMVQQLLFGQPWGDHPLSNTGLLIVGPLTFLLTGGLIYLFYQIQLITEVRADCLYLRFAPFTSQKIPFNEIKGCAVRTYSPIREYGGWGIRYGRRGKAYNISGNRGVELEFIQGSPLLIGSQKPEALAEAIKAYL
jgi:hypothetical protein